MAMFTETKRNFSSLSLILQTLGSAIGSLVLSLLFVLVLDGLNLGQNKLVQDERADYVIGPILVLGLGACAAGLVRTMFGREVSREGRWVWLPPSCLLLITLVSGGRIYFADTLRGFLWPRGEQGWALLLTIPVYASIGYSVAMKLHRLGAEVGPKSTA